MVMKTRRGFRFESVQWNLGATLLASSAAVIVVLLLLLLLLLVVVDVVVVLEASGRISAGSLREEAQ